jgi:hypothetical protein
VFQDLEHVGTGHFSGRLSRKVENTDLGTQHNRTHALLPAKRPHEQGEDRAANEREDDGTDAANAI